MLELVVVLALASVRVHRLVTEDVITAPMRHRFIRLVRRISGAPNQDYDAPMSIDEDSLKAYVEQQLASKKAHADAALYRRAAWKFEYMLGCASCAPLWVACIGRWGVATRYGLIVAQALAAATLATELLKHFYSPPDWPEGMAWPPGRLRDKKVKS